MAALLTATDNPPTNKHTTINSGKHIIFVKQKKMKIEDEKFGEQNKRKNKVFKYEYVGGRYRI